MIGGWIHPRGTRYTFEMAVCESCGKGCRLQGSVEKNSKRTATFMLSKMLPKVYEKTDIHGRSYDRLCGDCIERIEMLEAKRAGEREVPYQ